MNNGNAVVRYDDSTKKVIAEVDKELSAYYFSLIPKYKVAQPQKYPPHITIVRSHPIERIPDFTYWKKYEGERISFTYTGQILFREPYYYLTIQSSDIGRIRMELGLPEYRGDFSCYHLTIGNVKE